MIEIGWSSVGTSNSDALSGIETDLGEYECLEKAVLAELLRNWREVSLEIFPLGGKLSFKLPATSEGGVGRPLLLRDV